MAKPFVLPRSVQVGPFWYELRREALPSDRWGKCDNEHHVLAISETTLGPQFVNTMLHEFIHAVESVWEVEISEKDAERLASGLMQTLQSAGLLPERMVLEGEDA